MSTFLSFTNAASTASNTDRGFSSHYYHPSFAKMLKLSTCVLTLVATFSRVSFAEPVSQPEPTVNPIPVASQTAASVNANAKADWTPLLKSMQNGCDLPDFDSAPPALLASIVVNDDKKATKSLGAGYKVLNLKNAFAWGYPIKKIQYGAMGAGFSSATVYFTDSRFMALRPKFYINTASGKLKASDRTIINDRNAFAGQYLANGMGYNDGRVGVNFSKKTNSITCSWAHLTS